MPVFRVKSTWLEKTSFKMYSENFASKLDPCVDTHMPKSELLECRKYNFKLLKTTQFGEVFKVL